MEQAVSEGRERGRRRPRFATVVEALEARQQLATFHWANNHDGNINDPASWLNQANPQGVPEPNDDATIGFSGITVTVPASASVNGPASGAKLSVTGGRSVSPTWRWARRSRNWCSPAARGSSSRFSPTPIALGRAGIVKSLAWKTGRKGGQPAGLAAIGERVGPAGSPATGRDGMDRARGGACRAPARAAPGGRPGRIGDDARHRAMARQEFLR
jgi:hypothetical protein